MKKAKAKHGKTRNYILYGLSIIILATIVILKKKEIIGEKTFTQVNIGKVEKKDINEFITAGGKIHPEKIVKIAPDASGEIIGIYVNEGDSVHKGQLLLKINPDIYLSNLERAKASLNSSKANLANAKASLLQAEAQFKKTESDYNRAKELYNKKVISKAEYESIESQYEIAKINIFSTKQSIKSSEYSISNVKASLKEAQDNLTKTALYSPIDGIVSSIEKETGERVSGASQFSPGTPVMTISNMNIMEVQVDVSENDIIKVKINDTAIIEVDAYWGEKFKGIVTEIANSSINEQLSSDQLTNYLVKVRILPSSYKKLYSGTNTLPFRPGMSATVEILTKQLKDVLAVPIEAVISINDTLGDIAEAVPIDNVFIFSNDSVFLRKVKIGSQNYKHFEVLEGLEEGEEIVIGPYRTINNILKDKQRVEISKIKNLEL